MKSALLAEIMISVRIPGVKNRGKLFAERSRRSVSLQTVAKASRLPHASIYHLPALFGITLLLASCDGSREDDAESSDRKTTPPSVTKSVRPAEAEEPAVTRSSLQRSLAAAVEQPAAGDRDQALMSVIEEAMEFDTEIAREAFARLSADHPDRDRRVEHFALRLAEQDVGEAFDWAQALETDEERSLAFGNIALVVSAENPEGAAQVLSDSGVEGHDFDVAVVQVLQRWAARSPAEAASWVVRFDEGEARSAGLKAVTSAWLEQDPQATYDWVASLADPAMRQEAVTGLAESILEYPEPLQVEKLASATPEVRLRFEEMKAEADAQ